MIFVSIGDPDMEKCLSFIDKYKKVELRLDLIRPDIDDLPLLISAAEMVICTYRSSDDPKTSLKYILKALEYGTDIVDFSLSKPDSDITEVASYCRRYDKKLMLSYHNFEYTPESEFLEGLINEADTYNPDLIKIACLAKNDADNERLLTLMKVNERIVPVPMGEAGIKGRLKAYLQGSPVVYAYPDDGEATAPGQLPFMGYSDMDKIISIIYR
jgi:3-dehydroquinate dehydratase I